MAKYRYFKFDSKYYNPEVINAGGQPTKAYYKEYDKLYREADKRLSKLREKGFGEYAVVKYYDKLLKPRKDILSQDFPQALSDLHRFLNRSTNTATDFYKQDSAFLDMLKERGVKIPRKKLGKFYDYLDKVKELNMGKLYDSERALEVVGEAVRLEIDSDELLKNFARYEESIEDLKELRKRSSNSVNYLEVLERKKDKDLFKPVAGRTRRAEAERKKSNKRPRRK